MKEGDGRWVFAWFSFSVFRPLWPGCQDPSLALLGYQPPGPGPWQGRRKKMRVGGRGLRGRCEAGHRPSHPPKAPRGGRSRGEPGLGWASGEQDHRLPHCRGHVETGLGQSEGTAAEPGDGTELNGSTQSCGQSWAAQHPALTGELVGRPLSAPSGPGLARLVQGFQAWGLFSWYIQGLMGGQLQKEMATHSSILAWEVPWTEEPGGLHSMGSQKGRK